MLLYENAQSSNARVEPHNISLPPSASLSPINPGPLPSSSMPPQNADPVVKPTSDAILNQTEGSKVKAANDPALKVSQCGRFSNTIYRQGIQGSSKDEADKVHRVRIEPERTGWAKLYDLVRQVDKDRVEDIRDDIDTLLVFVSSLSHPWTWKLILNRPVCSLPSSRHSSSSRTKTCSSSPKSLRTKFLCSFRAKLQVSLLMGTSLIPPCPTSPLHHFRDPNMRFSSTSSGSSASSSLL